MAVYVDDMRASFGRMILCHMVADTSQELFAMALAIGVNTKWVQQWNRGGEHFDICLAKRALAVKHGAIECTWEWVGVRESFLLAQSREEAVIWMHEMMQRSPTPGGCPTPYPGGTCGCGDNHPTDVSAFRVWQPVINHQRVFANGA
jgi:uncharacterized protein DUF4031